MNINLRITGITSMKDSRICMSGYNMETQMYYRPILPDQHLTNTFLHQPNGDISLFSLVTFEKSTIDVNENPPHIEDFPITGKVIDINNNLINNDEQKTFLRKIADKTIENGIIYFFAYIFMRLRCLPSNPRRPVTEEENNIQFNSHYFDELFNIMVDNTYTQTTSIITTSEITL